VSRSGQLRFVEFHVLPEDLGVDAPLVLRAAAGRDPLDDDLTLTRRHARIAEEARAEDAHPGR
jgi:hypothetical protein